MTIWRYNSNGTLDTTFDSDGFVSHHGAAGGSGNDIGYSIQIQSDGKYVVAGVSRGATTNDDMTIWRYNSNGTLDTTFDSDGFVSHNSAAGANHADVARSMKIQSDGKYVVTGYSLALTGGLDMVIWRFNSNGTLDTTFDSDGFVSHNSACGGNNNDIGYSIIIQEDGKYVATGQSRAADLTDYMAIWRYNPDGTLDTSLNSVGYMVFNLGSVTVAFSIQNQSDGKYVISGRTNDLIVWRYANLFQVSNLDASLDVTYNDTNIEVGETEGVYGEQTLQLQETDGTLLAQVVTDMTSDRAWSTVSGDSSLTEYKSYVSNLQSAPGVTGLMTLFVPYSEEHNHVGICPGAVSLEEVTPDCTGFYALDINDDNVWVVEEGGVSYWQVFGLPGTGGFGFYEEEPTPETLPETGDSFEDLFLIGLLSTALFLAFIQTKAGKFSKYSYYFSKNAAKSL
jgi:uncharacterized delta-60 repeat protein